MAKKIFTRGTRSLEFYQKEQKMMKNRHLLRRGHTCVHGCMFTFGTTKIITFGTAKIITCNPEKLFLHFDFFLHFPVFAIRVEKANWMYILYNVLYLPDVSPLYKLLPSHRK